MLEIDAEVGLDEVTPDFLQALRRLEPFGMGNPEPRFAARSVRLLQPPRFLKEKHVKMKIGVTNVHAGSAQETSDVPARTNWRRMISYDAMGWRMAERATEAKLLPGDTLDIAFSVGENDHAEFGGLELTLCDFVLAKAASSQVGK